MTNYSRGADFERRVVKELTATGYYAMRSAGSHGIVDVVALCTTDMWGRGDVHDMLIQCKLKGVLSGRESNELFIVADKYDRLPILAKNNKGKTMYLRVDIYEKQDKWEVLDVGR